MNNESDIDVRQSREKFFCKAYGHMVHDLYQGSWCCRETTCGSQYNSQTGELLIKPWGAGR